MNIGIDLGTSYSLAARLEFDGSPTLIPDARDSKRFHTPSAVLVSGRSAYVGTVAQDMVEIQPDLSLIQFFKRHLGNHEPLFFDDQGSPWHPEGVSALVLDKLRFDAETEMSRHVEGAVITVPAHFNDPQRKAVAAAATLAGLPLLGLVEEPVAAALHYGVSTKAHKQILMAYDFGGGTFDATLLSLDENGIYVLAKSGLTELGGKELDETIGQMILEQFEGALGRKLDLSTQALLELRRASEDIKIDLCMPGGRKVHRPVILGGDAVEVTVERDAFNKAIGKYIDQTIESTGRCLKESGLAKKDVNAVLLVGGSSMVPAVAERLRALFNEDGQEVLYHEPSKAVAYGAAMRAAQMSGEAEDFGLPAELKGVSGYNVGVRALDASSGDASIHTLIKQNTPLPSRIHKTYYTTSADQRNILLDFVQFADNPDNSVGLGRLTIGPITSPRLNYPVDVEVAYEEDGTVNVIATDATSGNRLEQSFGGDTKGDIEYLAQQRKALASVLTSRR